VGRAIAGGLATPDVHDSARSTTRDRRKFGRTNIDAVQGTADRCGTVAKADCDQGDKPHLRQTSLEQAVRMAAGMR